MEHVADGLDLPYVHTMYLDKPLAAHNLTQAIARVNRIFGEKPIKELQDEAIPAMRSAFEQLQGVIHGFDCTVALEVNPGNVLRVYVGAVDHVAGRGAARGRGDGLTAVTGNGQPAGDGFSTKLWLLSVPDGGDRTCPRKWYHYPNDQLRPRSTFGSIRRLGG